MRKQLHARFVVLCLALLLALFVGSSRPAAALSKICYASGCCQECDWYDSNGDLVSSIYWCFHDCPN